MHWIMSGGGPLICLERHLEGSWGGIDKLTIPHGDAKTDYDRACQLKGYLNVLPVLGGEAIILGDMPLDTSFCRARSGALMIARVIYACLDFDDKFESIIAELDESIFDRPSETSHFAFATPSVSMFDSAEPGYDILEGSLHFDVTPGSYRVLTREYEPDPENSLVMHKFVLLP